MSKYILAVLALTLGLQMSAGAITLSGEAPGSSAVYAPTVSAVKKAMEAMHIEYTIDEDGDILYKTEDGYNVFVIFNKLSDGTVWNLQIMAQFSAKRSCYNDLVTFANEWNANKKHPKISMSDGDTLRMILNLPIQYGFNPDEFEDNGISLFERTMNQALEETDDMLL